MKKTEAKKILNKICEKYSIFEIRRDKFLRVFSVTDYGDDAFMYIDNDDMRVMLFLPYPLKEITPLCKTFSCTSVSYYLMTKNKYSAGEYAKAQKYSEWGAWLCILSVVLSILFMPFSMLML